MNKSFFNSVISLVLMAGMSASSFFQGQASTRSTRGSSIRRGNRPGCNYPAYSNRECDRRVRQMKRNAAKAAKRDGFNADGFPLREAA